jgi:hypothetical protein
MAESSVLVLRTLPGAVASWSKANVVPFFTNKDVFLTTCGKVVRFIATCCEALWQFSKPYLKITGEYLKTKVIQIIKFSWATLTTLAVHGKDLVLQGWGDLVSWVATHPVQAHWFGIGFMSCAISITILFLAYNWIFSSPD